MIELFLIACAVAIGWTISLYLWPFAPCGKCLGSGRNAGSNKRRFGICGRCGGNGRRRRLGAAVVHKTMRDTIDYRKKRR
jgi:DnaJ-class molecular chaperone